MRDWSQCEWRAVTVWHSVPDLATWVVTRCYRAVQQHHHHHHFWHMYVTAVRLFLCKPHLVWISKAICGRPTAHSLQVFSEKLLTQQQAARASLPLLGFPAPSEHSSFPPSPAKHLPAQHAAASSSIVAIILWQADVRVVEAARLPCVCPIALV